MQDLKFTIYGNPKAQKRHRFARRGSYIAAIDDSKDDKADFLAQVMQHRPTIPWDKSVAVEMVFVLPHPKSHFRTGKHAGELRPDIPYMCARKPDIDNYVKLVLDAMNGVFFLDDAQVVKIEAQKRYDHLPERPRTEVMLSYMVI